VKAAELYLVRHGQAAGSDSSDPRLSDEGRARVVALGARLADTGIAEIRHSPRRRAVETAQLLARALPGTPVRASSVLDDRTPVPSPANRHLYPERYHAWLDDTPPDERDVDGAALTATAAELATAARLNATRGPLLVVTHAFVIGWLVRTALDAPTARWLGLNPADASLTIIRYMPDEMRLVAFNDTGHLG
jgi:serine/threonine-protein phosphatase PGAM5